MIDSLTDIAYTVEVVSWHGGLAQLGERLPYKQRVTGSSPVSSISLRPLSLRAFFWIVKLIQRLNFDCDIVKVKKILPKLLN